MLNNSCTSSFKELADVDSETRIAFKCIKWRACSERRSDSRLHQSLTTRAYIKQSACRDPRDLLARPATKPKYSVAYLVSE